MPQVYKTKPGSKKRNKLNKKILKNAVAARTLEEQVKSCQGLIIWTDNDREGENIGFEIIDVCRNVNQELKVYRARFSEITQLSIERALSNLQEPNQNISNAVDARQELDLKIGAAFTRFQTLNLRRSLPDIITNSTIVSFGTCQLPTLGFVVRRYEEITAFMPVQYWDIKDYDWKRDRLYDQELCQSLLDACRSNPIARIISISEGETRKARPLPLNTVELQKQVSRILHINVNETMTIVEQLDADKQYVQLYLEGGISYPRTDTNAFPENLDLHSLLEQQLWPEYRAFVDRIMANGGPTPRRGDRYDEAHPPIYPTRYLPGLTGNKLIVYEFIVRSFLACCFKDAVGLETVVTLDIAHEEFTANGLRIIENNYLDIYDIYEQWSEKQMHNYEIDETFEPTTIEIEEHETSSPDLLSEADLIGLMDDNQIGTDATHALHITTIVTRNYVQYENDVKMRPTNLGRALIEAYNNMGLEELSQPNLRAQLEVNLQEIAEGRRQKGEVLEIQIQNYSRIFRTANQNAHMLIAAVRTHVQ